ncbi:MAG: ribosome maturation factor RimP [Actinomycetaceae bacterium]|nr:ribosome maturation factor RimP [Actinomycetaceae bacterium]
MSLLEPVVVQAGLFLEEVRLVKAGRHTSLRVTVDLESGPGGVGSDQLADVTRAISNVLDEADPISGSYNLEVSTPGATRDLIEARHFSRAIGRLVNMKLTDGRTIKGRITGVVNETINMTVDDEEQQIAVADIKKANVVLEMKR